MQESEVIRAIHRAFPDRRDVTPIGIGDDCAYLSSPGHLVTTDASVEGVHFDLSLMTFADAAYRCLASNLSDVAAMGGYARGWTLALGLRGDMSEATVCAGISAMRQCLLDHGLSDAWLVGGDVVRSPHIFLSVTMWGECEEKGERWQPVTRGGASPGDVIVLLGRAGYAAAGLESLRRRGEKAVEDAAFERVKAHFLRPVSLTQLGPALARAGVVSAMMDTSDGLYADLPRLLEQSHVGATVSLDALSGGKDDLDVVAEALGRSPRYFRLYGGEDFGLLATVPVKMVDCVEKLAYFYAVPMRVVGKIEATQGIRWQQGGQLASLEDHSFSHF